MRFQMSFFGLRVLLNIVLSEYSFFTWADPGLFFNLFCLFKHITNFTTNRYVKNVHPVYSAGIRTHDLWNMSLLP